MRHILKKYLFQGHISIHAPLAGCDRGRTLWSGWGTNFNPRTPCGVRLHVVAIVQRVPHISIHAPLAGCDDPLAVLAQDKQVFQSTHPLRGATLLILPTRLHQDRFQSTHPLRGATAPQEIMPHVEAISIHAPLAGCDQAVVDKKQDRRHISIHAPLAGCDFWLLSREAWIQISIHAPLAGCDLINSVNKEKVKSFQSTHPLRGATAPAAGKLLGQSFQSTHPLRGATCLLRILKSSEKFQSTHPLRGATCLIWSAVLGT